MHCRHNYLNCIVHRLVNGADVADRLTQGFPSFLISPSLPSFSFLSFPLFFLPFSSSHLLSPSLPPLPMLFFALPCLPSVLLGNWFISLSVCWWQQGSWAEFRDDKGIKSEHFLEQSGHPYLSQHNSDATQFPSHCSPLLYTVTEAHQVSC